VRLGTTKDAVRVAPATSISDQASDKPAGFSATSRRGKRRPAEPSFDLLALDFGAAGVGIFDVHEVAAIRLR
jgi:hypothetical protein